MKKLLIKNCCRSYQGEQCVNSNMLILPANWDSVWSICENNFIGIDGTSSNERNISHFVVSIVPDGDLASFGARTFVHRGQGCHCHATRDQSSILQCRKIGHVGLVAITRNRTLVPCLSVKAPLLIWNWDFIYGYPSFKQVAAILQGWEDTKVSATRQTHNVINT